MHINQLMVIILITYPHDCKLKLIFIIHLLMLKALSTFIFTKYVKALNDLIRENNS